jgi:polysaccharide export outer membrane protein
MEMFRKWIFGVVIASSVFLMGGCVSSDTGGGSLPTAGSAAPVLESSSDLGGAYKLRPLDPIYIRFSGILEQQQLELVIDANGEIRLLHLDEPIKAAGLSASQLAHEIEKRYLKAGIYKHLSVSVTMTAKAYYVQGEVNAPGQFQLMSGTTLLQAIAGARGYTPFANKKKVSILRHGKIYTYNAKDLEKHPEKDVKIKAGDVIKVWQQWY